MKLLKISVAAGLLVAATATAKPIESEVNYRLTMPVMEKCHTASIALMKRAKADAAVRSEQEKEASAPEDATLEQTAAFMKRQAPASTAVLVQNGCEPLELVKVMMAGFEAAMTQVVIDAKGKVEDLAPIAKENAAFMKQNAARLKAMQAELAVAQKAANLKKSDAD